MVGMEVVVREQGIGKQDEDNLDKALKKGDQNNGREAQGVGRWEEDTCKQDKGEKDKGEQDKGEQDKGERDKGEQDKGEQDKRKQDKGEQDKGKQDKGEPVKGGQGNQKQEKGDQDEGYVEKRDQCEVEPGKGVLSMKDHPCCANRCNCTCGEEKDALEGQGWSREDDDVAPGHVNGRSEGSGTQNTCSVLEDVAVKKLSNDNCRPCAGATVPTVQYHPTHRACFSSLECPAQSSYGTAHCSPAATSACNPHNNNHEKNQYLSVQTSLRSPTSPTLPGDCFPNPFPGIAGTGIVAGVRTMSEPRSELGADVSSVPCDSQRRLSGELESGPPSLVFTHSKCRPLVECGPGLLRMSPGSRGPGLWPVPGHLYEARKQQQGCGIPPLSPSGGKKTLWHSSTGTHPVPVPVPAPFSNANTTHLASLASAPTRTHSGVPNPGYKSKRHGVGSQRERTRSNSWVPPLYFPELNPSCEITEFPAVSPRKPSRMGPSDGTVLSTRGTLEVNQGPDSNPLGEEVPGSPKAVVRRSTWVATNQGLMGPNGFPGMAVEAPLRLGRHHSGTRSSCLLVTGHTVCESAAGPLNRECGMWTGGPGDSQGVASNGTEELQKDGVGTSSEDELDVVTLEDQTRRAATRATSLEGKLELLTLQRKLSAAKCQSFLAALEEYTAKGGQPEEIASARASSTERKNRRRRRLGERRTDFRRQVDVPPGVVDTSADVMLSGPKMHHVHEPALQRSQLISNHLPFLPAEREALTMGMPRVRMERRHSDSRAFKELVPEVLQGLGGASPELAGYKKGTGVHRSMDSPDKKNLMASPLSGHSPCSFPRGRALLSVVPNSLHESSSFGASSLTSHVSPEARAFSPLGKGRRQTSLGVYSSPLKLQEAKQDVDTSCSGTPHSSSSSGNFGLNGSPLTLSTSGDGNLEVGLHCLP